MINDFKPLKHDLVYYTSFYQKNLYKGRINANLTIKQFATLLNVYLLEYYCNKVVTSNGLRPLVCYSTTRINLFLSVLLDNNYIKLIPPLTPRKDSKGIKKDKYYTLTPEGINKVKYFHKLMYNDIKKFENINTWKDHTPKTKKYYRSLGILQ